MQRSHPPLNFLPDRSVPIRYEYRINVNPVVLGAGSALFANIKDQLNLQLLSAKTYASGVVGLHYQKG